MHTSTNCQTCNVTTLHNVLVPASFIKSCSYNVTCLTFDDKEENYNFILKDCELLPTPLCSDTYDDLAEVTQYINVTVTSTSVLTSSVTISPMPITTSIFVTKTQSCTFTTATATIYATSSAHSPKACLSSNTIFSSPSITVTSKKSDLPVLGTSTKAATSSSYCAYTSTEILCLPSSSPSITVTPDLPVVSASTIGQFTLHTFHTSTLLLQ